VTETTQLGVSIALGGTPQNGQTWTLAKLASQQTKYGWRIWQYDWKAAEGKHTLMSRATNMAGQTQPLSQEWNPPG